MHPEIVQVLQQFLVYCFKFTIISQALWNTELLSFSLSGVLKIYSHVLLQALLEKFVY